MCSILESVIVIVKRPASIRRKDLDIRYKTCRHYFSMLSWPSVRSKLIFNIVPEEGESIDTSF